MSAQTEILNHAVPPLSYAEAVAAILMACATTDGALTVEENGRMNEILASNRWLLGCTTAEAASVATQVLNMMTDRGRSIVLSAAAATIPKGLRETAFSLAVDIALADGRLGSRENALLDELQHLLEINDQRTRTIVDVISIKNRASGPPDP
jgi:tellurite resistance protein